MPKYSHEFLQKWYANFKKQVYEKANIDMDCKEDLGRIKDFCVTEWTMEDPFDPQGELMYSCIPHNGTQYDNEQVPPIDDVDVYLQWMQDNVQMPVTDEQIESLFEKSRNGTLFAIDPGTGYQGMRLVQTDEEGNVAVSVPISQLREDAPGVPDEYKMPKQPIEVNEPMPHTFYLTQAPLPPEEPEKPKPPKNMKPSFWSRLMFNLFGTDNDYAKKYAYEEAMEKYEEAMEEYREELEEYEQEIKTWQENQIEGTPKYEAALQAYPEKRAAYEKELDEYMKHPMGRAYAILNGLTFKHVGTLDVDNLGADGLDPEHRLLVRDVVFWKKQHSKLPQGQILTGLEKTQELIGNAKSTNKILNGLFGHQATPDTFDFLVQKNIYTPGLHKMPWYTLPKTTTRNKAKFDEFVGEWRKRFETAAFAAFSQPDIMGDPALEGFSAEETAKLNYGVALDHLVTAVRPGSDQYMKYLGPARERGNAAIQAFFEGEVGPMADLLRNSLRMTNRVVANMSAPDSPECLNTLHLVDRMWALVESDRVLWKEIGMSEEELEETKANVALHKTLQKGIAAKQKILEYTLHRRKMEPEEIQQAAADMLLGYRVMDAIKGEYEEMSETIRNKPEYQEAAEKLAQNGNDQTAINRMKLMEQDRPGFNITKNLLNDQWVKEAKNALLKNCGLDRLTTMSREEVGKIIASQLEFRKLFDKQEVQKPAAQGIEKEMVQTKAQEKQFGITN